MNLFGRAKSWLPATAKLAAGVTVTYTRGGTTVTVSAMQGRTVFASIQDGGPKIEFGDRDYLILATDLVLFGEPAIGDRVVDTGEVYEVLTPGTGEPAWRWSDPAHAMYRIHTKQVQ